MVQQFDPEADRVIAAVTPGPRLVVIGSTAFWGDDSPALCVALATELAGVEGLVAVTGGMDGVGLTFGQAFGAARRAAGVPENLFHILPHGSGPCDCGVTLHAGHDFFERREILGRVGNAYLVVEGGPGTVHEADVAAARGAPVFPLGRTGGHAAARHAATRCPPGYPEADWALLADRGAAHERVVTAVVRLVRVAVGEPGNGGVPAGRR